MDNYKVFSLLEPHGSKIVAFERKHKRLMRLLEPLALILDRFIENKLHHNMDRLETLAHPQEDYLQISDKAPLFAVADGVTLEIAPDGTYPNPSGAGAVAQIFCDSALKQGEKKYNNFTEHDILNMFRNGNLAVQEYNIFQGRVTDALNYLDIDLFSATCAFGALKEGVFYWGSLCDSYVAHYDCFMHLKFRSPECWPQNRRYLPADWEARSENERNIEIRKKYRNGITKNGNLCGYGVITGEQSAEQYLNQGTLQVEQGDRIFLYTDGFENYFNIPEFLDIFRKWEEGSIQDNVETITAKKSRENGAMYGHERTLIAINIGENSHE